MTVIWEAGEVCSRAAVMRHVFSWRGVIGVAESMGFKVVWREEAEASVREGYSPLLTLTSSLPTPVPFSCGVVMSGDSGIQRPRLFVVCV